MLNRKLDKILPKVQKPGRYVGGELNSVIKNKENVDVLQILDLLKDFEQYVDEDMVAATYIISSYIKKIGMKRSDVDEYITLFPDRVYKYIYEMRLYNVFA